MKKFTKTLALLLTVALCISLLAGCGSKNEVKETVSAAPSASQGTEAQVPPRQPGKPRRSPLCLTEGPL